MLKRYISLLDNNPLESFKRGLKIGFFFGFSVFITFISIASEMFAGDNIIANLDFIPTLVNMIIALNLPMWCGWVAGNSFFFLSHAGAGKKSA